MISLPLIFALNAIFEGVGAILTWRDVLILRRDRRVAGVSWWARGWWGAWGISNLWYYSTVQDPFSFWAGAALALGNCTWVAHAAWYLRAEKQVAEWAEANRRWRAKHCGAKAPRLVDIPREPGRWAGCSAPDCEVCTWARARGWGREAERRTRVWAGCEDPLCQGRPPCIECRWREAAE